MTPEERAAAIVREHRVRLYGDAGNYTVVVGESAIRDAITAAIREAVDAEGGALRARVTALSRWNCDCLNAGPNGEVAEGDDSIYCQRWVVLASDLDAALGLPAHAPDCALAVNARHGCTCGRDERHRAGARDE